jgi:addiction module HigA family antidote
MTKAKSLAETTVEVTKTADRTFKSRTMTPDAADDPLRPVHPGEILREEFLIPLRYNAPRAAEAMLLPRSRIERLWKEETPITADTALRLERFLGASAEFWMNLQARFDLAISRRAVAASLADISRAQHAG